MNRSSGGSKPSGRERLIEAAVEIIAEKGSAGLRVSELVERANVSLGLIAHHFGSRDGLVAVAQRRLFEGAIEQDLDGIATAVEVYPTRDQLLMAFRQVTRQMLDPHRAEVRLRRLAAVGTAHGSDSNGHGPGHPSAYELIAETTGDLLDRLETLIATLQKRGIVRPSLDARAIATFVQAYGLGVVVTDLDPRSPSRDDLSAVIDQVVEFLMTPDPDDRSADHGVSNGKKSQSAVNPNDGQAAAYDA